LASIGLRRHGPADGRHSPARGPHARRNTTQPECVKCTFFAYLRQAALVALWLCATAGARADPSEFEDTATRDPDYAAGKVAIDKKNWNEAVKRLQQTAVREPDNADVHSFLGYAYRHLNQFDLAFEHYNRAIALNPRLRGAHEYIGEAYLIVNVLPSAQKHLAALREICLLPCEELGDLEKAVRQYRAKTGQ
jgi:tetratricopeptide (TPR) repeat protein